MKTVNIGTFSTNGNIIVTDPAYEVDNSLNRTLKVKPGIYHCFLVYGKLKNPIFRWDHLPHNFRNSRLTIQHESYLGELKFTRTSTTIGVDSGQAGFFNLESYNKESNSPVELIGYPLSFFRENLTTKTFEIEETRKVISEKTSNDLFNHMKKECFKGSDLETLKFFEQRLETELFSLENSKKILETRNYPNYIKTKHSSDFYEIMCDLSKRDFHAGVLNPFGVVSSSGEGDGGYSLHLSKNSQKEIIGAYLNFINPKYMIAT